MHALLTRFTPVSLSIVILPDGVFRRFGTGIAGNLPTVVRVRENRDRLPSNPRSTSGDYAQTEKLSPLPVGILESDTIFNEALSGRESYCRGSIAVWSCRRSGAVCQRAERFVAMFAVIDERD